MGNIEEAILELSDGNKLEVFSYKVAKARELLNLLEREKDLVKELTQMRKLLDEWEEENGELAEKLRDL